MNFVFLHTAVNSGALICCIFIYFIIWLFVPILFYFYCICVVLLVTVFLMRLKNYNSYQVSISRNMLSSVQGSSKHENVVTFGT